MKMCLVPEWRKLLRKAWSVRLMVVAGACSGAEVVLPLFQDTIPRGIFAGLTIVAAIAALVSRFVAQPKMNDGD